MKMHYNKLGGRPSCGCKTGPMTRNKDMVTCRRCLAVLSSSKSHYKLTKARVSHREYARLCDALEQLLRLDSPLDMKLVAMKALKKERDDVIY